MPVAEIEKRIRVVRMAARGMKLEHIELAATAVLTRRRLGMTYRARYNDRTAERVVSPQRIVHYRGNWYLDGWRHAREDIRSFAVDGIQALEPLELPCSEDRAAHGHPQVLPGPRGAHCEALAVDRYA